MSTPGPCEVLVVGAGPTGLTLAATLAALGVRSRIIDKTAAPSDKSRAIGVQAGSLEALGQFFGTALANRMVEAGHKAQDAFFHFGNRQPIHVNLRLIPSAYDFVLILRQNETERFLTEEMTRHSLAVERRTELVALNQNDQGIVAQLRGPDGNVEEAAAQFVVGCDGAHSIVRREA
ncbi:MAG TPA: FAD-dependent monooxygenase, partial [Pirellulales bacterium]|nr:FAD-dependent monooxygenase [Pirellulales bacterium]